MSNERLPLRQPSTKEVIAIWRIGGYAVIAGRKPVKTNEIHQRKVCPMKEKNVFQMHFRLAQLRARLCQAMDAGDAQQAEEISRQIDCYQISQLRDEKDVKMPG